MHFRNIYNIPPNFIKLAEEYEFFNPFVSVTPDGKARINFKDPDAVRALNKALLMKDFSLNVCFPEGSLTPTIPLRLNYILWIEDMLVEAGVIKTLDDKTDRVSGIDVGTGGSVIYALLASRKNGWRMVGTEVNPEYVQIAKDNVQRNNLDELVSIVQCNKRDDDKGGGILSPVLTSAPLLKDDGPCHSFVMCNPPFFACEEESNYGPHLSRRQNKSTTIGDSDVDTDMHSPQLSRPPPSNAKTGMSVELVAAGGELQFVECMIQESLQFPKKVLIYTTMLGIKRHVKMLISYLKRHGVFSYTTTEFIQGKTMRWGLAWSFLVTLLPPEPDLTATFPSILPTMGFEAAVTSYLHDLNLERMECIDSSDGDVVLEIVALKNTWSNQRRLRRLQKRLHDQGATEEEIQSATKLQKISGAKSSSTGTAEKGTPTNDPQILLHCFVHLTREEETGGSKMWMRFRQGSLGKEGLHQIMQYLKNRIESDLKDSSSQLVNGTF